MSKSEYLRRVFELIKENSWIDKSGDIVENFFLPFSSKECSIGLIVKVNGEVGKLELSTSDWIDDLPILAYPGEYIIEMSLSVSELKLNEAYIVCTPEETMISQLAQNIEKFFQATLLPRFDFINLAGSVRGYEVEHEWRVSHISKDSKYYGISLVDPIRKDVFIIRPNGFYQVRTNHVFLLTDLKPNYLGLISQYDIGDTIQYFCSQYFDSDGKFFISDVVLSNSLRLVGEPEPVDHTKAAIFEYITGRLDKLMYQLPDMKQALSEIRKKIYNERKRIPIKG